MQGFYIFFVLIACIVFSMFFFRNFGIDNTGPKNHSLKKLLIVPLDGVVVETNNAFWPAIRDLLEANEVSASEINTDLLNLLTGMSSDQMAGHIRERFGLMTARRKLVEQFSTFVSERLADESFVVDGFDQFHKKLEELGVAVAVRTGTSVVQLEILDNQFGLTKAFDGRIYCSEKVEKVGEKLILYILNKLGVAKDDCVVLFKKQEDADLATKNGFKAVSIDYRKSVRGDGKIVANLKPLDSLYHEVVQKLNLDFS